VAGLGFANPMRSLMETRAWLGVRRFPPDGEKSPRNKSQPRESNPQPPHYECGALPIEARLAYIELTPKTCVQLAY
jgi:hypothetical protein